MITGTSQAELADQSESLSVPPVRERSETREHAILAYTLGVKQMIVTTTRLMTGLSIMPRPNMREAICRPE